MVLQLAWAPWCGLPRTRAGWSTRLQRDHVPDGRHVSVASADVPRSRRRSRHVPVSNERKDATHDVSPQGPVMRAIPPRSALCKSRQACLSWRLQRPTTLLKRPPIRPHTTTLVQERAAGCVSAGVADHLRGPPLLKCAGTHGPLDQPPAPCGRCVRHRRGTDSSELDPKGGVPVRGPMRARGGARLSRSIPLSPGRRPNGFIHRHMWRHRKGTASVSFLKLARAYRPCDRAAVPE